MTWLLVMIRVPGTPSIRTTTPDPDSSVGFDFPGAGGFTASTETTHGAIWRMMASKRSLRIAGGRWLGAADGGAGRLWAVRSARLASRAVPARPPRNAQLPSVKVETNQFIGCVAKKRLVIRSRRDGAQLAAHGPGRGRPDRRQEIRVSCRRPVPARGPGAAVGRRPPQL